MKKFDIVLGVLLMSIAAAGWLETATWPGGGQQAGLSPKDYPRLVFAMLALCGLLIAGRAAKGGNGGEPPCVRWDKVLPVALLLAVYALVLEFVGFILPTAMFLLISMAFFGVTSLLRNVIISVMGTAVLYVAFVFFLQVQF
ncbi:MAG: tripartite tricarboxylate transporter TctB family protein [Acidaminococcales bacterium]|jgi:hypothetical protein|nr:tripartite tricarboxylate transporter TctB family protein [Acidaminococcales bacterium]